MSDQETDQIVDPVVDEAAPVAENGSHEPAQSAPKRKRVRKSSAGAATAALVEEGDPVPAPPVTEEIADMVAEGGPVGTELERQLGVDELPQDVVASETAELDQPTTEEAPVADAETEAAPVAASESDDAPATEAEAETVEPVVAEVPRYATDPIAPGPGNPSPDGSTIAYLLTDADGSTRLWLSALDGSTASSIELPFRAVFDEEGPQWSPDGTLIALTGSAPSEIGTAIWLAPVDGGNCVLLADHRASDEQPRWSPDGTLLAFASTRHGRGAICVATPDGFGPVVQLTHAATGQDDRNPCWEPNSQRIAYTRHMVDGEQSGDQIWTVSILTGEEKQATKKLANRSQLQWCPGKSQIAFVTDESDWLNIGVVNPDNSAGWNLASEAGDKSSPRYSLDGNRIMYTRRVRGEVRLVERPTSGANADPLDPGLGVAAAPRWLPEKRVVYQFASITSPPSFVVQEAAKDASRLYLPLPGDWVEQDWYQPPGHSEYEISGGLKSGALIYRDPRETKPLPAIVLLGSTPHLGNDFVFDAGTQALVQNGFVVVIPTLTGTPGYGKKIVNALDDRAGTESEISDLVDLVGWVRGLEYVDSAKVSMVGEGYGGALALLLAGARPGTTEAVAVVDPVTDWDDELDQSDDAFSLWQLKHLGLPSANRGRSALRTPTTFAGVIECPLLLVSTSKASLGRAVQTERFAGALDELEVPYQRETVENGSSWDVAEKIAAFLTEPVKPVAVKAAPKKRSRKKAATDDVLVVEAAGDAPAEEIIVAADATGTEEEFVEIVIEEILVTDEPVAEGVTNVGHGMRTDEI